MPRQLDVLFINPGGAAQIYQDLHQKFSAIETPTWCLLLAQACRSNGFGVQILDADAERLSYESTVTRVKDANPRLVCFVVYGQNPNSGTTSMQGAVETAKLLKESYPEYKIMFIGSHTSALPHEVLRYKCVDFVCINEGVRTLQQFLHEMDGGEYKKIPGLGYKEFGFQHINPGYGTIIPSDRMDMEMPGYAWDLLPYKNKPLDLYRAHFWHAEFDHNNRTPFAALYTSLGCQFKCEFCMINIINRVNEQEGAHAAFSNSMRFWSPQFIIKEFTKLIETYGVQTIRISDEMFFLNKVYFEPLLNLIITRGYGENIRLWSYSRIDTVREQYLELFRKAGMKYLALGIESSSQEIRQEITKGKFREINIRDIVKKIRRHDISVIANYIYGLPGDTHESMQKTLDLAIELNTEMYNAYPAQALPGSPLYYKAQEAGYKLPNTFSGWSFLSEDCQPLPTQHLSAAEVLKFRDEAFYKYFNRPEYFYMIEKKFGTIAVKNIRDMLSIPLKRKLLVENNIEVVPPEPVEYVFAAEKGQPEFRAVDIMAMAMKTWMDNLDDEEKELVTQYLLNHDMKEVLDAMENLTCIL